jgi:hypothetical protein
MAKSRHQQVFERADSRCEYCQLSQEDTVLPHELDHIRSQKHSGVTTLDNLCLACARCNAYKGPLASGYDPHTDELVRLFNPHGDDWDEHFQRDGPTPVGRTAIGRATIVVLRINEEDRIEHRRLLRAANRLPPGRR